MWEFFDRRKQHEFVPENTVRISDSQFAIYERIFFFHLRTENCTFCESKTFSLLVLLYLLENCAIQTQNVILNFACTWNTIEMSILIVEYHWTQILIQVWPVSGHVRAIIRSLRSIHLLLSKEEARFIPWTKQQRILLNFRHLRHRTLLKVILF